MDQPRHVDRTGAGASADLVGSLEHLHVHTATCEVYRGSEPIGPAADDYGLCHLLTSCSLPLTLVRIFGSETTCGSVAARSARTSSVH